MPGRSIRRRNCPTEGVPVGVSFMNEIRAYRRIVLGKSTQQVLDITAMAVKAARILLGTYAAGGPRFMSERDVARIHTRPDELYRRQQLGLEGKKQGTEVGALRAT